MKYCYSHYYEHLPVDGKAVLLESFHGKTVNDSPLAIAREIQRLYPGQYKLYYATNGTKGHTELLRNAGVDAELVDISSRKYNRILATAKYIISNASLPMYYIRRSGQIYLQTWHGTPLKTLGKEMREGIESMCNVQHNFMQATHLMFPNEFTRDVIMRDYNLEKLYTGRIILCGYPRNAVFFDREGSSEIRRRYDLGDKTVYAYMPTWRGINNRSIETGGYFDEVRDIFGRLDSMLRDDQVFYVNFHPIIGGSFSFDEYRHIRPFPADTDQYSFLNAADALVTDYSSVFFDYSITRKPVVLFMYDYDKYMADRGMYLDIRELPFTKVYDKDEFVRGIASDEYLKEPLADKSYEDKYLRYDAPDCTEKLVRTVFEGEAAGYPAEDLSDNKQKRIRVIAPDQISSEEDLAMISQIASEHTADEEAVVLMYRKWFKSGFGPLLHDKYNDTFNYVITEGGAPKTYLTQIMRMLGSKKARAKVHAADIKRCFGELDVDPKYIKVNTLRTAAFAGCRSGRGELRLDAIAKGLKADQVTGAELRLEARGEERIVRPEIRCEDTKKGCRISILIRQSDMNDMTPLRWSCRISFSKDGEDRSLQIQNRSRKARALLKIQNTGTRTDDGYILYPYIDGSSMIKLCFRKVTEYDTLSVRAKEIAAMALYMIIGRSLRRKQHYVIYEKFSRSAQDNSYYFFRYCMEQLPPEERRRFYYVIDKKATEYANVREFGGQVIGFMSIRHMLYAMSARLLISTDAVPHAYAWQTRPSLVYSRLRKKPVFFLQHGVTAMKRVDGLFGAKGNTPMKYFAVTSETEQDIVVREFGYERACVPVTGFTRWDALEDRRDPEDRFILVMPTWRSWLEDVRDEEFVRSEYYLRYIDLLTSPELQKLLTDNDLRMVFYIHPRFAGYISAFSGKLPERIELVPFGEKSLNDIIMRASMLITDYSSVCWDMLYMDKPVVFYQFDADRYLTEHGSYIDFETELPGPRAADNGTLLENVRKCIGDGFAVSGEYEGRVRRFFPSRDHNNCERTYQFLKEKEK